MPLTQIEKKELKYKKGRYRSVFATSLGRWVLGDIVFNVCCFGIPATTQDIATRQAVGKEILCLMDLWAGEGQTMNPEGFINKLSGKEEIKEKKRWWKKRQ